MTRPYRRASGGRIVVTTLGVILGLSFMVALCYVLTFGFRWPT